MKRDYCFSNRESLSSTGSCGSSGNANMWPDGGFDELFAAVGYSVRSSEMAEVAQKMEQLEEAMGTIQQGGLSQLVPETVHYNPSDLSSWVESMLSGLNPEPGSGYYSTCLDPFLDSSTFTAGAGSNNTIVSVSSGKVDLDDFGSDLIAIPGKAVFKPPSPKPQVKKLKTSPFLEAPVKALQSETFRPVVLVDSQENGVRLVHTLMACAEAVQQEKLKLAEALVKNVGFLAVSQAGAMRKVATYFAEALARRIYRMCPAYQHDSAFTDLLQMHFYETCPYLKFAHFTANQAILEAFAGKNRVHVIDFSMKQGMQWPSLLQALALRPGGPPSFRLTGIGSSPPDDKDHLQEVGWKLARLAESINVEFEYRSFVANSLADLNAAMFETRVEEAVAVNSIFELHPLLAQPGAIDKVLQVVRNLTPEILTVVEQEANHNDDSFLDRFTESLHYYSTLFDSLESGGTASNEAATAHDRLMTEIYLGRQICNVVACEGADRVERHEVLAGWRARFLSSGFNQVQLGSNAYKQASMLLALFAGGDGYMVEENNGCLMLGWHTRPLIAASAWKLG